MYFALPRFVRYTTVGVSTFLFDLGMLYVAVQYLGIPFYIATPISFLIAVSCNYVLSRRLAFAETTRGYGSGYAYFILFALAGAAVTTGLVSFFVTALYMNYLLARVLVSFIVGIANYLCNLFFNFKLAGHH